jgi:hypothetical protein
MLASAPSEMAPEVGFQATSFHKLKIFRWKHSHALTAAFFSLRFCRIHVVFAATV